MKTLIPFFPRAALCACIFCFISAARAQHGLLREVYTNVFSATGVQGLTQNANFPNNPAISGTIPDFEAPENFGDSYGQRVSGYIVAPQTGNYTFWIASDDQSQLWLSTDQQPQNKVLVAEVRTSAAPRQYDKEFGQKSAPIHLEQGTRYYVEALMYDRTGPDNLSVRWQLPDGTVEDPVASQHLYVELIPPQISGQPVSVTADEGTPAVFDVQLVNKGPVNYQWFRNDVALPGETNRTLVIPAATLADNNSRYQVQVTNLFSTAPLMSFPAFLSVNPDFTPPVINSVQTSGENDLLTVVFSEPVDPATAQNRASYSIAGTQVLSASLNADGQTVILQTTPLVPNNPYTLVVTGIRDVAAAGNEIDPGTIADFTFGFVPLDTGLVYGRPESPGPSSRRTALALSEIMYHPAPRTDGRNLEFVEIYNSDDIIASVGGYRLGGSIDYTFPAGAFIQPHGYAVVAAVPLDVQAVYGLPRVFGPYGSTLPASGTLRLYSDEGALLLETAYDSSGDWPSAPDGAGPSLVLARPSYGEADARAWAASDAMGGSPGKAELIGNNLYAGLVVNEFLANSEAPDLDFIELYNYSPREIDLSGVIITDDISTNKFQFPAHTKIAPLGFVSVDEIDLGFALSSSGERIILRDPQKTRVIESIKFDAQGMGISMGRFPDGNPRLRQLAQPTPGRPNARGTLPPVVISEIMYEPISGNENEEYVELYNRSASPVNLKGWRLDDAVSFTFADDTVLAPGAYLAIAKDVALLRTNHPGLSAANSIGNFSGKLANGGDRIALERPEISIALNGTQRVTNVLHVLVNEVKYGSGGRWPHWAAGGGSSLELIDLNSDNSLPSNWADSDETQKSSWVTIERRGMVDNGPTNFPAATPSRNLHILMMGTSEALLDNAQVFYDKGNNVVNNPGLERGLTGWLAGGTHDQSTLEPGSGHNSTNALHIRASERGDTAANRIRVRLNTGITNGSIVTLKADMRWLRGDPEVLLRLHGNYLEAPGILPVPKDLGTPGAPNSVAAGNTGPAITAVQHTPVLPAAGQNATVIASVTDPDHVAVVSLYYRPDPSPAYIQVPMSYNGAGLYTAAIPGMGPQGSAAFYVEGIDAKGALSRFPADPNQECVIVFGEVQPPGSLSSYRLWLTQKNIQRWTDRENSSNEPLDATFVYNNERIIYNMGTLYSGSPFHWSGYNGPLGNNANYLMHFPDDDLFLGQNDFVLNLPSNVGSDDTAVREQTFFWMVDQMNQPYNHRRFHRLYINGEDRDAGKAFEDAQQPNGDFIKEWFPSNSDGELYKIEDWFEYDDSYAFRNQDAELIAVWTTNVVTGLPELKQERYRWWFRKRAVKDSAHDYSDLLQLVKAVNDPDPEKFEAETASLVNIDQWMGATAMRHAAGDWDSYGYRRGKNMYAYKPPGGKWELLHWDVAFAFGLGDGTTHDIFDVSHFGGSIDPIDTITKRMMDTPAFRRAYLRAIYEAANGPFIPARVNPIIDAKYSALVANGVSVNPPDALKSWIAARHDFLLTTVAGASSGFAITSNNGNNYSTNRNTVTLTGIAPVNVKTIRVNGVEYPVKWTSVTGWELHLALKPQLNVLKIEGFDTADNPVAGASSSMTINVTTAGEPIAGKVVINEIQYNPAVPGTGFIELFNSARNTSYDLSGYQLNGADFTFPSGSVIAPGGFLVVAADANAFGQQYGFTIPVAGQLNGTLQNGGEAISLVSPGVGTNAMVISAVRYSNAAPWPLVASGTGASLQLIDASQDPSRVANWMAQPGIATPGATNSVRASVAAFPLLWVNEVQPNNSGAIKDSAGQNDPWVELYNSSSAAISLNGLYLTDDLANLTKWALPASGLIAPGQHLVIWLDGETAQSTGTELHANFRLNPQGSAIALSGAVRGAPAVLDYLSWTTVPAGQSYGAYPEGQAVHRANFYKPTPGTSNDLSAPAVQVYINEWMASNSRTLQDPSDLKFDDWFELYNADSTAADLSGYSLSGNLTNANKFQIPNGTVIPAKGYLLVWADSDKTTNGQLHVNFKLSADGESIGLFAPDGSLVDSVTFGPQSADVSSGRLSDGGPLIGVLSTPSPGASNTGGSASGLRITQAAVNNGNFALTWQSEAGANYTIQYKNAVDEATWSAGPTVNASGSTASASVPVSGSFRFYRIVKQ